MVDAFAVLNFKQRGIDEDGWLHATVEDFRLAKDVFMKRSASHQTYLTNFHTRIVASVLRLQDEVCYGNRPDGATQAKIATDLGVSIQAVNKALLAIEENTRYIVHEKGPNGTNHYRCTVSALEVCYTEGDLITLPDDYKDPVIQSTIDQQPINQQSTNQSTNNINKHKIDRESNQLKVDESLPLSLDSEVHEVELPKESKLIPLSTEKKLIPVDSASADPAVCGSAVDSLLIGSHDQQQATVDRQLIAKQRHSRIASPLRLLQDRPTFVGADGQTYGPFKADDVVNLPAINATGLVRKKVAVFLTDKNDPVRIDIEAEIRAGEERAKAKAEHEKTPTVRNKSSFEEKNAALRLGGVA